MRKFNVAYFTASCDDEDTNRRFAESLDLDYPILSDPKREVAAKYGVVNEKRKNPFRWTFYIGTDSKILEIDKGVKSGTHGADCVAKLKELGVATR